MSVNMTSNDTMYKDMLEHRYHQIVCVTYGFNGEHDSVAIECETCNVVLFDACRPDINVRRESWKESR